MSYLSQRVNALPESPSIALTNQASALKNQGYQVVSLAAGNPEMETPRAVKEAAEQSVWHHQMGYQPVSGLASLRQAVVDRYAREYGIDFDADQVTITTGAKHSLYNIFQCLIDPADEVIVITPYWVSYPSIIQLAQGKTVLVESQVQDDFQLPVANILAAITKRTKAIVINSPHNPTGVVYHQQRLKALAQGLQAHPNVMVITDEIYDQVYWQDKPVHLAQVAPELKDRLILVNGVSKNYAMAGWRVGFTIGPKPVIEAINRLQSQSISCVNGVAQCAATAALALTASDLAPMVQTYQQQVSQAVKRLQPLGMKIVPPSGTFYVFANIENIMEQWGFADDMAFCQALLNNQHVAVLPGSACGMPGYIRVSCGAQSDAFELGLDRIEQFLQTQQKVSNE